MRILRAVGGCFAAGLLFSCVWLHAANAAAGAAPALLKATGIRGGLCLVVGAKDPARAEALAKGSALYVQALQPDFKTALKWGLRFAVGPLREQLGARNAAFNAEDYGSKLFNLIVVENPAALGQAKMTDLERILVPRGVAVFKKPPAGFEAAAKKLKMETVSVAGFASAFRKATKPVEWKLPLATKWTAGPRTQISNGYTGIVSGNGMLFYLERMERDQGNLKLSAARLFARDACNGRTIWSREVPGWSRYAGLAATGEGRLFVRAPSAKVFALDGATGKFLFQVAPKINREARIRLLNDELLWIGGKVHSTKTGKFLWRVPFYRYQPLPETIIGKNVYFSNGKTLFAKKLADGAELWKKPLALPKPYARMSRAGKYLLVRMKGTKVDCVFAILNPADGKVLWSYTWKVRIGKERYFGAGNVKFTAVGDKLVLYYRHNQANIYADEIVATRLDLATGKEEIKDKVITPAGDFHGCFGGLHLGKYISYYDLWFDTKALTTTLVHMPHPACFFGTKTAYGLVYNFPSRKSGPVSAVGPADKVFGKAPGGQVLKTFGRPGSSAPLKPDDWPMFRGAPAGGNFTKSILGTNLSKAWETALGVGEKNFGIMSSRRTGLTQAVIGYGLALAGDMDGQRVVALDVTNGKEKWVFPVGSRVDYPPTLYKGRCLFAARDGWVRCLDAKTGALLWKLLVPARERYIGGREKLESTWPLASDVLIVNGVAYVAGGAPGGLAFNPESGKIVQAKNPGSAALGRQAVPGGRELMFSYGVLTKGNSIPRTNEDNWSGFRMRRFKRRLDGRVLAFDGKLAVAFKFYPRGEGWANKGVLHLFAVEKNPKKPLWKSPPIELLVDDIVLTPQYAYCAGHYQRVKKAPELWVVSRTDGKVVSKTPLGGFPAFLGMSAAGKRLFIATRGGKLLCFEGK